MANVTDASQNKVRTAEEVNFEIARGMAEIVRSTLGPLGRDKMMVDSSGRTVITNDGATILRETNFVHPTASLIVGVARTQESESYDGTTSAIILTGELVQQAEGLIQRGVHTTLIERGYNIALKEALNHLDSLSVNIESDEQLLQVANVAMTGKQAEAYKDTLGPLCVEAAKSTRPSKVNILVRPGASVEDSLATTGLMIDKQMMNHGMPKKLDKGSIALFDCDLTLPAHTAGVNVNFDSGEAADLYAQKRKEDILKIGQHIVDMGINVVFSMKEIDPVLSEYFARNNVIAFRRTNNSLLERVAETTNAMIVSSLGDLEAEDLGTCGEVVEVSNPAWDKPIMQLNDVANPVGYSILITGPTEHVASEIARALDDAIGVTWIAHNEKAVVNGGGSTHVNMAMHLKQFANSVGGLEQLAVESFANALEVIPATLAQNSGLQPLPSIIALRAAIASGIPHASLNVFKGGVCTEELAVIEPKKVVTVALESATTAASQILRIDNIIQAKEAEFME
jgi:chaperonin GroEL (HSP60 family)